MCESAAQNEHGPVTPPTIRERADQLRALPLEPVLQVWGAQRDRDDPRKWHTSQGILSVSGAKFMNWNCGIGGGGAIDLVIHLTHLGFLKALQWLEEHFPVPITALPAQPPPQPNFLQPIPDPGKLGRVRHYLLTQRGLPHILIDPLIHSGSLYADPRANAVFLLRDPQNLPVGAELRGTTARPWRGMSPGSRKDLGFFAAPAVPVSAIILCESAIDALSCSALHPRHLCVSTAGARPNPRWLPAFIDQGHRIYCGFDADPTGDAMALAMISIYPTVKRLRPSLKDWNDVLRSRP
jgi:hypothetical protein